MPPKVDLVRSKLNEQGVPAALAGLGIHVYDYGPDQLIPPAIYIYPETIPYHESFATGDDLAEPTWVVRIRCSLRFISPPSWVPAAAWT